MLEEITVKNYALMDNVSLSFTEGLNVLTGETGAGKSILAGALSLLMGQKASSDVVRTGCDEAVVSGILRYRPNPEIDEWLARYEISPEDNTLIIRRTIKPSGRGSIYVQEVPVLRGALEELASSLFDMHSQHEHQSLFFTDNHRKLLDRYGRLDNQLESFRILFNSWCEARTELDEILNSNEDQEAETTRLRAEIKEIDEGRLIDPDEEETLTERQKVLSHSEDLHKLLSRFQGLCAEGQGGALSSIRKALGFLEDIIKIDTGLNSQYDRFKNLFYEIEDVTQTLDDYQRNIDFSPEELVRCDERLALITRLQKKYGLTISDILSYKKKAEEQLQGFENRDDTIDNLKKKVAELTESVKKDAEDLSRKREEISLKLNSEIQDVLTELGMEKSVFNISITPRCDSRGKPSCAPHGMDRVEFLLSANPGEPLKPLKSVASGGELSRVMLALKTVFAQADNIPTLVFDEIDTGIGGTVARSMGKHLKKLSVYKQIFSITHLASIAVFADNHIRVDKIVESDRTVTRLTSVSGEDRLLEISRMLAGDSEASASLAHARELLEGAVL